VKYFISESESSKELLRIARMSTNLPVNTLITGQVGVGKKLLAQEILPAATIFEANDLEKLLINKTIDIEQYNELIIININLALNKKEFLEFLENIKIVATISHLDSSIESYFAIKIDIPPLKDRKEDLNTLINIYLSEAKTIYEHNIDINNIEIDLSSNGISLKKSIFKNTLIKSMSDNDMMESLEYFIFNKFNENMEYKELLKYFEIPLLNAAKTKYKSQLQMATKLNINRITLRKKLDYYFGDK
jgi:DNA-binding NtrC family response regulator